MTDKISEAKTAGELAKAYNLKHLTNTYGDHIPNDWPLAPEGGWAEECGYGGDDVEYVDMPDGSRWAISCDEHHPRKDFP